MAASLVCGWLSGKQAFPRREPAGELQSRADGTSLIPKRMLPGPERSFVRRSVPVKDSYVTAVSSPPHAARSDHFLGVLWGQNKDNFANAKYDIN